MGKRYGARTLLYLSLVLLLSACGVSRVGTKDGAPDSRSSHSHALIDHAQNPTTNFDWFDAAVLSFKLTQLLIGQADEILNENSSSDLYLETS